MNTAWEELVEGVREQGSRLGQAEAQTDYNRLTGDIKTKVRDLRVELGSGVGVGTTCRVARNSSHNTRLQRWN